MKQPHTIQNTPLDSAREIARSHGEGTWKPVVIAAAMIPSRSRPVLKSKPLTIGVPSATGTDLTITASCASSSALSSVVFCGSAISLATIVRQALSLALILTLKVRHARLFHINQVAL